MYLRLRGDLGRSRSCHYNCLKDVSNACSDASQLSSETSSNDYTPPMLKPSMEAASFGKVSVNTTRENRR